MNPLTVEDCLLSALRPYFPTAEMKPGTNFEKLAPSVLNLIAAVPQVHHTAGPLWKADATIILAAPALLGVRLYADLDNASRALVDALKDGNFAAAWPDGSPQFRGLFVTMNQTAQHDDSWRVTANVTVGVEE